MNGKPVYKFSHCDEVDLEQKLHKLLKPNQKPIIITIGIIPLFGKMLHLKAGIKKIDFDVEETNVPIFARTLKNSVEIKKSE